MSTGLKAYGCILNQAGVEALQTPATYINEHPVYDAARRWSQWLRIIPRRQFFGYEVVNGKSVIWFRRYSLGTGGVPSRVSIAAGAMGIRPGCEYVVAGTGEIAYGDPLTAFHPGDHFIGQDGANDWYVNVGAPVVYELQTGILPQPGGSDLFEGIAEQIRHVAPERGFTVEWLMGMQFKPYHPSQSSLWKPSSHADYFPLHDPAAFYAPEVSNDRGMFWHLAYGQRIPGRYGGTLISELPSGYRYCPVDVPWGQQYLNQNYESRDDWDKFCASARIYEPDLDVESAEAVTEGTTELVKVTLSGRLHSTWGRTGGAPLSFSRDVSTWDLDALAAEPFGTADNRLRRYAAHMATGRNFPPLIGDHAWNSRVQDLTDNPYGSYYPEFYLVRAIPEPFIDDNDDQDVHDSPLYHDLLAMASTYLRVMAEGCVDQQQSVAQLLRYVTETGNLPATWGVHDYTHEEVWRQAFDGSWLGLMPGDPTALTPESNTRPDAPHGFWPPPATKVTAEVYNRFVDAVNLLTRYRLMIPYDVMAQSRAYYGWRQISWPETVSFNDTLRAWEDRVDAPTAVTPDAGNPTDLGVVTGAIAGAGCGLTVRTDGGRIEAESYRIDVTWWIQVANGIEDAFPPIVADLVSFGRVGVLVRRITTRSNMRRAVVPDPEDGEPLNEDPGWWYGDDGYYDWRTGEVNSSDVTVALETPGTIRPPALPDSDMGIGRSPSMPDGEFTKVGLSASGVVASFVPGQTLVIEVPLVDR